MRINNNYLFDSIDVKLLVDYFLLISIHIYIYLRRRWAEKEIFLEEEINRKKNENWRRLWKNVNIEFYSPSEFVWFEIIICEYY